MDRVPKAHQARVRRDLSRVFSAVDLENAVHAADRFFGKYGNEFPTACERLADDLDACLALYRFPEAH